MYLTELLDRQKENQKIAIKHGEKWIAYKEWYRQSKMISKMIDSNFSVDTKNIALFLPNSINYAVSYFGVLFSHKIIVPIGTESQELEIISTLEYCEIDLIITSLQYKEFLLSNLVNYRYCIAILLIDAERVVFINKNKNFIRKTELYQEFRNDNDVAIMLHTSGTISNPKRVMLTHNNLISNVESNIKSLLLTEEDIVLISMPMYFGYCNTAQFLTQLYLGAAMVILDGMFLPKLFFETVQNECITIFTGVPSMLLMLLEYKYAENYNLRSLRYICFGGGKMPINKLKVLIVKFPTIRFLQTYGQTEASPRITVLPPDDSLNKIGSVGVPIHNVKIKIVDEACIEVKAHVIGEIIVQGKNVMKGYYKQDKLTNETIVDEWLHTGDLGYMDDDRFLYLTGRKRNIIISGGINIYPEEIEEVLMQHPDILDTFVTSENHKILGEVPIAKIVLKNNINSANDFRNYCVGKLSNYKLPARYDIVNKISKTYNEKIKRY